MAENTTDTITVKKSTFRILTYVVVILLLGVAFTAGYMIRGGTTTQTDNQIPDNGNSQDLIQVQLAADDPVMGQTNAPVTIVAFSDFSCPYCAAASGDSPELVATMKSRSPSWTPPVPGIIDDYVKTGKAKLVFKYFPGHGTGQEAMKLAWCANEQGKFWDVHNLFFANQNQITNVTKLKELVAQTGTDMTALETCYASGKYDSKLNSDIAAGQAAGVSGTPTFIVNGKAVVGAVPFSDIKQVIDAELAK